MTIYELCEHKENTYRRLRDDALRSSMYDKLGNAKQWERKMLATRDYKMSLPIEIASFELTIDCPFRD